MAKKDTMNNVYYRNLIKRVIDASCGDTWEEAILEWEIIACKENKGGNSSCICGKENLRYLYTIHNKETGQTLSPIGSSCIHKFHRDDLNAKMKIQEDLFKLYHAIKEDKQIELSSQFFTKKLLLHLYKESAFQPNCYNHYCEENDYRFMLDMFNKRKKNDISEAQKRKINAIIAFAIKPFLQKQLSDQR